VNALIAYSFCVKRQFAAHWPAYSAALELLGYSGDIACARTAADPEIIELVEEQVGIVLRSAWSIA
jgi:hypothetical protein